MLYCALCVLLCACAPSAIPADTWSVTPPTSPASTNIDWRLSRSMGSLAVELVDSGKMQNVFKLTYEDMTDSYSFDLELFDQLVVYMPSADGVNALMLGCVYDEKQLADATLEFQTQAEALLETRPDADPLKNAEIVTYGRYILLSAAQDNTPVSELFERALTQ